MFFAMAKFWLDRELSYMDSSYRFRYDDNRIMEFVLMRLTFSDGLSGESSPYPPMFPCYRVPNHRCVVLDVFLLDPSERLLVAFIWMSTSNTIGLYALRDWGMFLSVLA